MAYNTMSMGSNADRNFPAVWMPPAALRQLAECGDQELVEELIAIFQADTAVRLQTMRAAVAGKNYAAVSAEAHTIKGSSVQVGANRVADVCRQMEEEARKSPAVDLAPLFSRLMLSFEEVCRVIAARTPPTL